MLEGVVDLEGEILALTCMASGSPAQGLCGSADGRIWVHLRHCRRPWGHLHLGKDDEKERLELLDLLRGVGLASVWITFTQ